MSGAAHAQGKKVFTADGKDYTLWFGISVLADLQAKYGQDVLALLEPPEPARGDWMPPLDIIHDLMLGALQRYHAQEANRWLVDDIIAQNENALGSMMQAALPDTPKDKPLGNAKRPRRAA